MDVNKNGENYEIGNDGTKSTFHGYVPKETSKTSTDASGQNKVASGYTQPMSKREQWLADRKQARLDSEKDINERDSHMIKHGDTMWDIARASCRNHSAKCPTAGEISQEIARLAKKNGITDPEKVAIGTIIDTSLDKRTS